jgi:hypothetical protein
VYNYWTEKQSCERHLKDDWEDDLGWERRSKIFRKVTIRDVRAVNRARVTKLLFSAIKDSKGYCCACKTVMS